MSSKLQYHPIVKALKANNNFVINDNANETDPLDVAIINIDAVVMLDNGCVCPIILYGTHEMHELYIDEQGEVHISNNIVGGIISILNYNFYAAISDYNNQYSKKSTNDNPTNIKSYLLLDFDGCDTFSYHERVFNNRRALEAIIENDGSIIFYPDNEVKKLDGFIILISINKSPVSPLIFL